MGFLLEVKGECFLVDIDAYAQVDIHEFATVIDIIGGIDITLSEAEANHMHLKPDANSASDTSEGLYHLNGQEAIAYCPLMQKKQE